MIRLYEKKDETRCATMDEVEAIMYDCDAENQEGFVDYSFNGAQTLLCIEFTETAEAGATGNGRRFIGYLNYKYPEIKVWGGYKTNDPDYFVCVPLEGYDFS